MSIYDNMLLFHLWLATWHVLVTPGGNLGNGMGPHISSICSGITASSKAPSITVKVSLICCSLHTEHVTLDLRPSGVVSAMSNLQNRASQLPTGVWCACLFVATLLNVSYKSYWLERLGGSETMTLMTCKWPWWPLSGSTSICSSHRKWPYLLLVWVPDEDNAVSTSDIFNQVACGTSSLEIYWISVNGIYWILLRTLLRTITAIHQDQKESIWTWVLAFLILATQC